MGKVTHLKDLNKLDGIIIVFSLEDSESFDAALDLLDFFKFDNASTYTLPILVLGNKMDLDHKR